jgi:serine/threonine protein kinase
MITDDFKIKYIDFGLSCVDNCHRNGCANRCVASIAGTLLYKPPELFKNNYLHTLMDSQAHDIWSLGIVMYQLANANFYSYPFEIKNIYGNLLNLKTIKRNIMLAPDFEKYPPFYFLDDGRTNILIENILINDPMLRPNITQILRLFNVYMAQSHYNKNNSLSE